MLGSDWFDRAREAKEQILAAEDDDARKQVLKDYDDVWQDAKPVLKRIMNGKCWYCETSDERSDNAVDHFRPKSRYPWLAFNDDNLRFSCTYCNSRRIDREEGTEGGKAANFPIWGVLAKADGDSLDDEKPLLLDPIKQQDPQMLWFDDLGRP